LGMTSWWHCEGPAIDCLSRAFLDVQQNLNTGNCTTKDCFPVNVPSNIESLRDLARTFWREESRTAGVTPDKSTVKFTPYMELMANVLVLKSRFCRLDFDVAAHLVELVASTQPCSGCLNNTNITNTTSTSTNSTA